MNLWLSSQFLVAGLFLSSSALTPEECQPLITPLSLADPSMMFGRSNLIMGHIDSEFYNDVLKNTESYWIDITPSPSRPKTLIMATENKMNGSCLSLDTNLTIGSNYGSSSFSKFSSVFHLLPSCEGCLVFSINRTIKNLDEMYRRMDIKTDVTVEDIKVHALYLMARETTVKDSDLEQFKKQASCLGFSKEADFIYDPKNDFCAKDEGRRIDEY